MKYTMKAGVLYSADKPSAKIKASLAGISKKIMLADDVTCLTADIHSTAANHNGDVRLREYTLTDSHSNTVATAHPLYAQGEEPENTGWPISHMPRVDHALAEIDGSSYTLTMHNSQNYSLADSNGGCVVRIMHNGLCGGWTVEDSTGFAPQLLCGIFVFCRYIEQENEFMVV